MKILMLNYDYPSLGGGAANTTYYLLREFDGRNDLSVDLVTSPASSSFSKERFTEISPRSNREVR